MGVKLTKYVCTLNIDNLNHTIQLLASENQDLEYLTSDIIPQKYFTSFLACYDIVKRFLAENHNEDIGDYNEEVLSQILEGTFFLKKYFSLIIMEDQVVGFQDVTIEGRTAVTFETLFVSEQIRGRGLGKWLVGSAIQECIQKIPDLKIIETNVNLENTAVLKTLKPFDFFHKTTIDSILNRDN